MNVRPATRDGRTSTRSRSYYITALREYEARYGELTAACFSPSAAKWGGRDDLRERYYAGRADGTPWPSLNAIKSEFGGWNAARAAAGFDANTPGPATSRRPPNVAAPIRIVDRVRYVPDDRLIAATHRAQRADERAARAVARAERLTEEVRELRRRPVATKTKTKVERHVERVKVVDGRAERRAERLANRLADTEAAARALRDQLKAATVEVEQERAARRAAERVAADASSEMAQGRAQVDREFERGNRTADRLAAVEGLVSRLEAERDEALARAEGASGATAAAAAASERVRRAERARVEAEEKVERTEREMHAMGAAVYGTPRKLTPAELAELRRRGPAGPSVLAKALEQLAKARRGQGDLAAALTALASAALNWRDRL